MRTPDYPAATIDASFTRKVITSNHIAYFCARCAGAIEVPTGTECCDKCAKVKP